MKRIGLFLGVEPYAGGMFQYAESLLGALGSLPGETYAITVAYIGPSWQRILGGYPFSAVEFKAGRAGQFLADALMAARIPGSVSRILATGLNPISWKLSRLNCDLWIFPAQDAIAYQLKLPVLATVHDLMHRYEPHFPEVVKGQRFNIREHRFRNLVTWARGVLVDSEVGRRHVVESYGVPAEKVHPLPYIANPQRCNPEEAVKIKARYGLPDKFIFYPAQFWAHKNHAALISAAADIRPDCPDIHLVFTGAKRHEYEAVYAHAAALNMLERITFADYVPDVDLPGFFRLARAMVMPTFFGPTNIPPLEALQHGCPVAVSDIYGMPEQLGDAALYFDPKSVPDMAQTLRTLWLEDGVCATLRTNALRQAETWGAPQFNCRLREILESVLSSPHAQANGS